MEYINQLLQNPTALMIDALIVLIVVVILMVARSSKREAALMSQLNQVERSVSEQLRHIESATLQQTQQSREEVSQNLRGMGDSVTRVMGEMARTQQTQLDAFAGQLQGINVKDEQRMDGMQKTVDQRLQAYQDRMDRVGDVLDDKLGRNAQHIELLRQSLEQRMESLQRDNGLRLQQIERTVDERLNTTLDRRLNESFHLVNERLERVYQGLGEMQSLASGVGDLKRVLTDVRTRGLVGEIQLGTLLSQLMTREQYETDVRIVPGGERVSFAIVLPGRTSEDRNSLLPIDASFPHEVYDRLIDALDRADQQRIEQLSRQLSDEVRAAAGRVSEQFIHPPRTTDFAVLFLGSEGLYAEVLRHPGLVEGLQREYRVTLTGPSTLSALLNSLQMGIKTLAIERRSEEVWALLGAVRGEIGNFAEALSRTQKRIRQASESIEDAAQKSRVIQRKLKGVDSLSESDRKRLLKSDALDEDEGYENSDWD